MGDAEIRAARIAKISGARAAGFNADGHEPVSTQIYTRVAIKQLQRVYVDTHPGAGPGVRRRRPRVMARLRLADRPRERILTIAIED